MQAVVSVGQSFDRPLDRQRSIFDIAEEADLPAPTPFRDRHRVLLLGDIKSHKDFAMLSHGPPSMHEARLGLPEQPSFLTARKGGPPAQHANMTSSQRRVILFFCPTRALVANRDSMRLRRRLFLARFPPGAVGSF
jgi:hypothetical protein